MTREEAIAYLKDFKRSGTYDNDSWEIDPEMDEALDIAITSLEAQGDMISRQAAINAIENTDCEMPSYAWDELTDAIMRVPSAHPEIIHCEECKYRKDNFMGDWCTCWCGWTSLDGHCHKGANKDE